jgi:hypothetical protein
MAGRVARRGDDDDLVRDLRLAIEKAKAAFLGHGLQIVGQVCFQPQWSAWRWVLMTISMSSGATSMLARSLSNVPLTAGLA